MKILLILSVMCSLLGAQPASAFLGDDQPTVEKLYGKMLRSSDASDGTLMTTYEAAGYRITINFVNGRSDCETFNRIGPVKAFPDDLINTFLRAHANGQAWQPKQDEDGRRNWDRPGAVAVYNPGSVLGPSLMIFATTPPKKDAVSASAVATPSATSHRVVATIKGNGDKTSDPFTITTQGGFTVEYESAQWLSLHVYRHFPTGELNEVSIAELHDGGKDHTFVSTPAGSFVIKAASMRGTYAITVTEPAAR